MNVLSELNNFLGNAMKATYAGGGARLETSQRPGFIELEYDEHPWSYRDSYAGFIRSVGHEVVWRDGTPFWSMIYCGGMTLEFTDSNEFADLTFLFLKKAMSTGEKCEVFQPRGPDVFIDGDWKYECDWSGSISDFKGSEAIRFENKISFTHDFYGGTIDWGNQNE
jgi:hypothetical protein